MRGMHRDRNFYIISHICDLCNKIRGANLEHCLAECDLLLELERLENAFPTKEINSYFFKKTANLTNEPDKKKQIQKAEPDTMTQPDPAHDVQILKQIKKTTKMISRSSSRSLFKTNHKINLFIQLNQNKRNLLSISFLSIY